MKIDYAWIKEHFDGVNNAGLCREYNSAHDTDIDPRLFNWHCKKVGCFSRGRKYTEAEKAWIKENYPLLGQSETARRFAEMFGRTVSPNTICKYYNKWLGGDGVSETRRKERYESVSAAEGTLSVNCRGEAKIKLNGKWVKATHSQVPVPKGMVAFNLDKDIYNNSPENIGITTNSKFRTLRNNGMWSENRELTKAGLMCTDLEYLLKEGE